MYTGKVRVGGPADVRELPELIVSKLAVGPYDNNAYLLRCRQTGSQVLIDAAAEPARLLDLVGPDGLQAVITTHRHADHWQALAEVVEQTGARCYAGELDAPAIDLPSDVLVADGDLIPVGAVQLRAMHLPGHTPGSIVLLYDDPQGHPHLFTGDCLFPGGVGNTQGDAERFATLLDGVVRLVFDALPDDTWVYPGHGHDTTVGIERDQVPGWRERGW